MTRRHIHYEAAFEELLRTSAIPYVAVDEAKRTIFAQSSLKSFDFLVYPSNGNKLVVDVKGRKVGRGGKHGGNYRQNWVNRADIEALTKWQGIFGPNYRVIFVFSYWIVSNQSINQWTKVYRFNNRDYCFWAIDVSQYQAKMRLRSTRWDTVALPAAEFRKLAIEIQEMIC